MKENKPFDVFDFSALLKTAFIRSFTVRHIQAGFEHADIRPFNASNIFGDSLLATDAKFAPIMTPDHIIALLNEGRAAKCRDII